MERLVARELMESARWRLRCVPLVFESTVVPVVNLETPGEGCHLTYAPPVPMPLRQCLVLSNSFGFGGLNASLALRAA